MEIPGIGEFTKDDEFGWYYGDPIVIPVLRGTECELVLQQYDDDPAQEDFHQAIRNFLSADLKVLEDAEPYIFQYYERCQGYFELDDDEVVKISSPSDIWPHIWLGREPVVTRRAYGDKGFYISLECNCAWEPEHGLQIVFKNGLKVNKVGPFDGHVTNSDAFADESLENVVFV